MKSIALTLSLLTGAPALAGVGLANDGITGCNYPTIAAAVANAAPNDTVWIGPGTYQENLGSVYKDLVISASGPSCGSPAQGGVTIAPGPRRGSCRWGPTICRPRRRPSSCTMCSWWVGALPLAGAFTWPTAAI